MKKIVILILACCLTLCLGCSTPSGKAQSGQTVYWVQGGTVYHIKKNCQYIAHRTDVKSGTIQQAKRAGKSRSCYACGNGK